MISTSFPIRDAWWFGAVNPPNIDLANEELLRSHLQAVWLTETGVKLGQSVRDVLDLENIDELPLLDENYASGRFNPSHRQSTDTCASNT